MYCFRASLACADIKCPQGRHYCLACGLKEINEEYTQQQFGGGQALDIEQYRRALATLYKDEGKFQLEVQADAMEALQCILQNLHSKAMGSQLVLLQDFSAEKCEPLCLAHSCFNLELYEQYQCECGQRSKLEPWDRSAFQYLLYAGDLLEALQPLMRSSRQHKGWVLRIAGQLAHALKVIDVQLTQDKKVDDRCPGTEPCSVRRSHRSLFLKSEPTVLVLNLVWSNPSPTNADVLTVLALLPQQLQPGQLFNTMDSSNYSLRGFITFGFAHYVAYFQSVGDWKWRKFDDSRVTEMQSYTMVLSDILRTKFHPVGVFYEKPLPSATVAVHTVKELDWQLLEGCANGNDSLSAAEPPWHCVCGRDNASGTQVCEDCFSLQPGREGWACTSCSSINHISERACLTCGRERLYLCRKCGNRGKTETCRNCTLRCRTCAKVISSGDTCEACRNETDLLGLNPVASCLQCGKGLNPVTNNCDYCLVSIPQRRNANQAAQPAKRQCTNCGQQHESEECTQSFARLLPCSHCKKIVCECMDTAQRCRHCSQTPCVCFGRSKTSIPQSLCLRCGATPCHCVVASTCLACHRSTEHCSCLGAETKQVDKRREPATHTKCETKISASLPITSLCPVCKVPLSHCLCPSPESVCLKCNYPSRNCRCSQTIPQSFASIQTSNYNPAQHLRPSPESMCLMCKRPTQSCKCQKPIAQSIAVCSKCRHLPGGCICKSIGYRSTQECERCRTRLDRAKYCSKCKQKTAASDSTCPSCFHSRDFLCEKCVRPTR